MCARHNASARLRAVASTSHDRTRRLCPPATAKVPQQPPGYPRLSRATAQSLHYSMPPAVPVVPGQPCDTWGSTVWSTSWSAGWPARQTLPEPRATTDRASTATAAPGAHSVQRRALGYPPKMKSTLASPSHDSQLSAQLRAATAANATAATHRSQLTPAQRDAHTPQAVHVHD